jgi:MFS family permease
MTSAPTATTYFYERLRAPAAGIIETAGQTFLLLIAVRVLSAGPTAKALIAGSTSVGFILSLLMVSAAASKGWVPTLAVSRLWFMGGLCFCAMAAWPVLPVVVAGAVIAMAATSLSVPLMTQVYNDNYADADRGRRFSRAIMFRVAAAALFSQAAGWLLTSDMSMYRILMLVYAGAFLFSAFCFRRIPARALHRNGGENPLSAFRHVKRDRRFRVTLISWMLLGFANLMMLPLRVEYLANEKYGLALSAGMIAFLVGVVPNVVRLAMSPVWGWLFDHMNIFALRVAVNIGFGLGIVTFFTSDSLPGLVLGAVFYGISSAGGDVSWSLWVTKIAPSRHVAEYMSVHTFFTGLRGLAAPLVAFHAATGFSIVSVGTFSALLVVAASALLATEIRPGKTARYDEEALAEPESE